MRCLVITPGLDLERERDRKNMFSTAGRAGTSLTHTHLH